VTPGGEVLVDARGLRCPWPVLRLARTARDQPLGTRIHLLADDPAAPGEVAALAAERGWRIESAPDREPHAIIVAV
jgi:tRNA 2-thiouridine synthesizing protein A